MRRIIALLLLSGLATMLASGAEQSITDSRPAVSRATIRQADREITVSGDRARHARLYAATRFQRTKYGTVPVEYALRRSSDTSFTHSADTGTYTYHETPGKPADGYRFEHGGYHVTFVPLFDTAGITFTATPRWNGVKEDLILTKDSPSILAWRIETNARLRLIGSEVQFLDRSGNVRFMVPAPTAWDNGGGTG